MNNWWMYRELSECCWWSCTISPSYCASITMWSVIRFRPIVSNWETSSYLPTQGTCDCPIHSLSPTSRYGTLQIGIPHPYRQLILFIGHFLEGGHDSGHGDGAEDVPQHQRHHERRIESTIGQLSADEKQCRLPPETPVVPHGTVDYRLIEGTEVTVLRRYWLFTLLQISSLPGNKYNTTVVNAIVLYVGMRAIETVNKKGQSVNIHTIAHSAFMDIFQNLTVQLDTEGEYGGRGGNNNQ